MSVPSHAPTRGSPPVETGRRYPIEVRQARTEDIPAIEELIVRSVMELMAEEYSLEQRLASIGPLFGVDRRVVDYVT